MLEAARRRVAALVRKTGNRREELRDREPYVDEAMRLLALAEIVEFDFTDPAEKWRVWKRIADTDAPSSQNTRTSAVTAYAELRQLSDVSVAFVPGV